MTDDNIINFEPEKTPKPEFVTVHEGTEYFMFCCSYEFIGVPNSFYIWAQSLEDAGARVEAMRHNLHVDGQVFSEEEE